MNVLGINAYNANASAAVFCDGRLVAAVEEERLRRIKNVAGFPSLAVRHCLDVAGIRPHEIDHVAVPQDPFARLGTKLVHAVRMPRFAWERARARGRFAGVKDALARSLDVDPKAIRARVHSVEHHRAHMASAFYCSPFERAAVLSVDGLGDFSSTMWGLGEGPGIEVFGSIGFPHSLGFFYTAVSQFLGFWKFGDEYKVMGLAALGAPRYLDAFRDVVRFAGTRYRLGLDYFVHARTGPVMSWADSDRTPVIERLFSDALANRLGLAPRAPDEPLTREHEDVASSLQRRLEEVYLQLVAEIAERTGETRACFAGGVAYNCVANGKVLGATPITRVYVPPAAGDAGLSVGAALEVWHGVLGRPRGFTMDHAFWGPESTTREIADAIARSAIGTEECGVVELAPEALIPRAADLVADGKIVGWFQGRTEWGPRALGHRSIVADPRRPEMKDVLNRRIKHRESFRPFAPSILEESTGDWFECSHPSPFMNLAFPVRPALRDRIPAPTHVDGSGRLQTVGRDTNPLFHALISAFRDRTGVPVVLNTSFNENEPIVCRPEEALDCFSRTRMDALVMGDFLITRADR